MQLKFPLIKRKDQEQTKQTRQEKRNSLQKQKEVVQLPQTARLHSDVSKKEQINLNYSYQDSYLQDEDKLSLPRKHSSTEKEQFSTRPNDVIKKNQLLSQIVPTQADLIPRRESFAGVLTKNGIWRPHLLQTIKLKENKEIQLLTKVKIKFTDFISKLKVRRTIKSYFIAIRALIRWKNLISPMLGRKNDNNEIFSICIQEVIFNNQLKIIKFKQWTYMVFSKVINTINREDLASSTILNIIDQTNIIEKKNYDWAQLKLSQLLKLLLEGLALMTSQQLFLKELAGEMFVQQFENQRQTFFLFTSSRTLYLQNTRDELIEQERNIVFTEFIIITLINNISIISHSEKAFSCQNDTSQFLLKLLISFLQYMFMNSFYKLKQVKLIKQRIYTQKAFKKRREGGVDIIDIPQNGETLEMFTGTYAMLQLKPLLDQQRWLTIMKNLFKTIISNLQNFDFKKS